MAAAIPAAPPLPYRAVLFLRWRINPSTRLSPFCSSSKMLVSTVLAASLLAPVFAAPYAVLRQRQIIEEPVLNITYSSPVNS